MKHGFNLSILCLSLSSQCFPGNPLDETAIQQATRQTIGRYALAKHVQDYLVHTMFPALAVERKYGLPAAGVLAMAGSEHSFCERDRCQKIREAHNHFGLKFCPQFQETHPTCKTFGTWEYRPECTAQACFTQFRSTYDSYMYLGRYLSERTNKWGWRPYKEVIENRDSPEAFLKALARSPYSTHIDKERQLLAVFQSYHLGDIVEQVKTETGWS